MEQISTSFDKTRMDYCNNRCIMRVSNSLFTPDELSCLNRYPFLDLDAQGTSQFRSLSPSEHELILKRLTSSPLSDPFNAFLIFIY